MDNVDDTFRKPNNSSIVSQETLKRADAHCYGALSEWRFRHATFLATNPQEKKFLNIAIEQLFESYEQGNVGALNSLDKLARCKQSRRCCQILCPVCRSARQMEAAEQIVSEFADVSESEIKFMTLLISVEKDAAALPSRMEDTRKRLRNALNNNKVRLGADEKPFNMVGAFECDLKNLATQADASLRSQELVKGLGLDPQHKPSQYLLHLHAVVGPLDKPRLKALKAIIEKALGGLLPYQLHFKSLHTDTEKSVNLATLGRYMYKARLQFSDNIFDDNWMQKKAKYHTPYKGKELVDYLNVIDEMRNFKGLQFECRLKTK